MYEEHFGLAARPFQLTPDPRFWFETETHRRAMAYLGYGLQQGEGFIVVTGDVGAGKTTLVGHLMERIDGGRINPIRIVSTQVEADDLLRIVAGALGTEPAGRSKAELLVAIERGLHAVARTGRHTLLIVDEAQALPVSALEELRMLSNFQAGGQALIQIFLTGQPEFRERLSGAEGLEQLRQRVIATHHLDPMGTDEVEPYVAHRLQVAGWQGRPDFADDAFPALHAWSGGVPRRLNRLAGRVLLHCAVEGVELVDAEVVDAVAADDAAESAARPAPVAAAAEPSCQVTIDVAAVPAPVAPEAVDVAQPEPVADPVPVTIEPEPGTTAAPESEPELIAPAPVGAAPVRPRPYLVPNVAAHAEPEVEPAPRPIQLTQPLSPEPELAPMPATLPVPDEPTVGALLDRLAAIEARLDTQDAALRRVLTLLVDWVEADASAPDRAAA